MKNMDLLDKAERIGVAIIAFAMLIICAEIVHSQHRLARILAETTAKLDAIEYYFRGGIPPQGGPDDNTQK